MPSPKPRPSPYSNPAWHLWWATHITRPLPVFLAFTKHSPVSGALHCSCLCHQRFLPLTVTSVLPSNEDPHSGLPGPSKSIKTAATSPALLLSIPYPGCHNPTSYYLSEYWLCLQAAARELHGVKNCVTVIAASLESRPAPGTHPALCSALP